MAAVKLQIRDSATPLGHSTASLVQDSAVLEELGNAIVNRTMHVLDVLTMCLVMSDPPETSTLTLRLSRNIARIARPSTLARRPTTVTRSSRELLLRLQVSQVVGIRQPGTLRHHTHRNRILGPLDFSPRMGRHNTTSSRLATNCDHASRRLHNRWRILLSP